MIDSLHNVDLEFFKQLLGQNMSYASSGVPLSDYSGNNFNATIRYAKLSSVDLTEEKIETYPIISINDFAPKPRPGYYFPDTSRFGELRDTDNDVSPDTITEFYDPINLVFKYQVSIASKSQSQWDAMKQYMTGFMYYNQKHFLFNQVTDFTDDLGDYVEYEIEHLSDNERRDGIFESIYEFTLYPYVYLKTPKDWAVLLNLNITVDAQQIIIAPTGAAPVYKDCSITVYIVNTPNPNHKITLINGDTIQVEYAPGNTLTILDDSGNPYMVNKHPLATFIVDNGYFQDEVFDITTGTFDHTQYGGFSSSNNPGVVTFDVSLLMS